MAPYESAKQNRFMHAQHPDIAAKWDREARRVKPRDVRPPPRIDEKKKRELADAALARLSRRRA